MRSIHVDLASPWVSKNVIDAVISETTEIGEFYGPPDKTNL